MCENNFEVKGGVSMLVKYFLVPKGYVCTVADFLITFFAMVVLASLIVMFANKLVVIPPLSSGLELKEASVVNVSGASKRDSYLYLRLHAGQVNSRDFVIEVPNADLENLGLYKGRQLLLAVDPEAKNPFLWGLYDRSGELLVGSELLVSWYKQVNNTSYFMICVFTSCFIFGAYRLVRYALWNRFLSR